MIMQVVAVDSQDKNKRRNLVLKIIIPIVVVAVIAGIWFFKTYEKPQEVAGVTSSVTSAEESKKTAASNTTVTTNESQETASSSSTATTTDETEEKINTDLVLEARDVSLDKLKLYKLPIIIDFGADSCIPCKEMAPVLKKLNAEWQGKVIVKFFDVWKYPDAAGDFPLQVIPTQFFFDAQGNPYVPSDPEGMQMILYSLKDTQEHVYTAHQGGLTEQQIRAVFEEMGIK